SENSVKLPITEKAELDSFYHRMSGNLMAYPYTETNPPAQTAAPKGYEPFHLEHYGRHGSRWLIGASDYTAPIERLERAERYGLLTPLGIEVLAALRNIQKASVKREGELSDKGAVQHQVIGRRIAETYPQIFAPGANVDAKSTVVIRCILSMLNGLEGIREIAPDVNIRSDASYADMYFMNFDDRKAWAHKDKADTTALAAYKARHDIGSDYLERLVTDSKFARDSVAPGMLPYLYWVLANTQGHTGQPWLLDKVFTPDEVRELWRQGNAGWFLHSGNSVLTDGRMPYTQRMLLRNFIESADTAMLSTVPSANLRYGHDGILVNAITLMELDRYGDRIDDLEQLEQIGWYDYDLIPKAGNLQLVFYRPKGSTNPDEVLVKALINEREVTLPVASETAPYYPWTAVRDYYMRKLDRFDTEWGE
ncbi:MAG: histidine-type phosphatase, partial [Muribaculaceae bacterium]|nr:histidine-type phosphatase [Muribaculaceae bacterium]